MHFSQYSIKMSYSISVDRSVMAIWTFNIECYAMLDLTFTAWKVSKYGVFFSPYFHVFGPEKTPYFDIFHALLTNKCLEFFQLFFTVKYPVVTTWFKIEFSNSVYTVFFMIYLFKVNNGNTRKNCEICSNLMSNVVMSLLLTLNRFHTSF